MLGLVKFQGGRWSRREEAGTGTREPFSFRLLSRMRPALPCRPYLRLQALRPFVPYVSEAGIHQPSPRSLRCMNCRKMGKREGGGESEFVPG